MNKRTLLHILVALIAGPVLTYLVGAWVAWDWSYMPMLNPIWRWLLLMLAAGISGTIFFFAQTDDD